MDVTISPNQLFRLRKYTRLTIAQAAERVGVSSRTWASYEAGQSKSSARKIPPPILELFCVKSNIAFPPIRDDLSLVTDTAKIICFTSMKGGVGKSPITLEVATTLANQGFKVAIISNDSVFRGHDEISMQQNASPCVHGSITFYDEEEVIFSDFELMELANKLKSHDINMHAGQNFSDEEILIYGRDIRRYRIKAEAVLSFDNIAKQYDYMFLDLSGMNQKIILLSDLIILVMDLSCHLSVDAGNKTLEHFKNINGGVKPQKIVGLITNKSSFNYCRDNVGNDSINSEQNEIITTERLADYRINSRNYCLACNSGFPVLKTCLSSAFSAEIAAYNKDRKLMHSFSYFDSLANISPNSMSSMEIRSLTAEINEYLNI